MRLEALEIATLTLLRYFARLSVALLLIQKLSTETEPLREIVGVKPPYEQWPRPTSAHSPSPPSRRPPSPLRRIPAPPHRPPSPQHLSESYPPLVLRLFNRCEVYRIRWLAGG
ncbi:hypothetical protein EJ06DRAFT_529606 [Trichodelitschia bisporula]|uniref:Uncharacterized protein n=1 Tax=Trichodelitschia bisporula TaxID=703511 RepID=A0A6G1HZL6_9PEZI|nr:hypothetical protein EJ06DRAFT_529606 [Trichodelitschia bisporula]